MVEQYAPIYKKEKLGRKMNKTDIWESVTNWPERSQVWPLTYSPMVLGLLAGVNGFYVHNSARNYLYLHQMGRLVSLFATTIIPAAAAGGMHHIYVSNDIVLGSTRCPVCLQTRAAFLQIGFGLLYPAIMTPVTMYPILNKMRKSVRLPSIVEKPKELFKFFGEVFAPMRRNLGYFAAAHMIVAMGITYLEQDSYLTNIAPLIRLAEQKKTTENKNVSA